MKQTRARHPAESGSVIIWIFITIALFAALSFTVAQMMRGGGDARLEELSRVQASEIIAHTESMRRAVQKLRIDGIPAAEISFAHDFHAGLYDNPRCTGAACRIYDRAGGGVTNIVPSPEWLDATRTAQPYYKEWHVAADTCVPDVGTGGATCAAANSSEEDLTVFLSWLKKPLCLEINRQLGIANNGDQPPSLSACPWATAASNRYTGTFINGGAVISGTTFNGRQNGCFRMGSCGTYPADSYHYYHVLMPR